MNSRDPLWKHSGTNPNRIPYPNISDELRDQRAFASPKRRLASERKKQSLEKRRQTLFARRRGAGKSWKREKGGRLKRIEGPPGASYWQARDRLQHEDHYSLYWNYIVNRDYDSESASEKPGQNESFFRW